MTSVTAFRDVLETEKKRLTDLYETWESVLKGKESLRREDWELVLAVVGQTKLILRGKFGQFLELIDSFEKCDEQEIRLNDLQGFWDLIHIQIADIDKKYRKLQALRENKWRSIRSADYNADKLDKKRPDSILRIDSRRK